MTANTLSSFIRDNIEPILQAWEDFARTVEPPALTMDDVELRDHAHQMLIAFAHDLETTQSEHERVEKSEGRGDRGAGDTAAMMDDMTRFNEAVDQALAESVARYERLVKQSRDMFLAILGHDLRNPLSVVTSGSGFIMQASDIPPKYVLAATRMFNGAKRMAGLINDLIDFTRTRLGPGIPIHAKDGDFVGICNQVIDELRTYHSEHQIVLNAPPRLESQFDAGRIGQMLSNLIGNAIQHGVGDSPIVVDLDGDDRQVTISVTNHGPAIPATRFNSIFDPLVRAGGGDNPMESTSLGIGLFIAREIARAHNGEVTVTSDPATGTRFTVSIPR